MPHGKILPYHALKTLIQLHAELAGKINANRKAGDALRGQMIQVEAVMKMLDPAFNARGISAKRRNIGNPWFKRGTLYRAVIDTLRRSQAPMTADDICKALLAGKRPAPTPKQDENLQAAILAALRKRNGTAVTGEGHPTRWHLVATK